MEVEPTCFGTPTMLMSYTTCVLLDFIAKINIMHKFKKPSILYPTYDYNFGYVPHIN